MKVKPAAFWSQEMGRRAMRETHEPMRCICQTSPECSIKGWKQQRWHTPWLLFSPRVSRKTLPDSSLYCTGGLEVLLFKTMLGFTRGQTENCGNWLGSLFPIGQLFHGEDHKRTTCPVAKWKNLPSRKGVYGSRRAEFGKNWRHHWQTAPRSLDRFQDSHSAGTQDPDSHIREARGYWAQGIPWSSLCLMVN